MRIMSGSGTLHEPQAIAGCLLKIRSMYPSFAKVHKRIADAILENPQQITKLPVTELAQLVKASEASVVLFCKKIGYAGYHEFKLMLAEEVFSSSSDIHEEIDRNDDTASIVQKVFNTSIQALKDSQRILDVKALEKSATLIAGASKVLVLGIGISGIIAQDFWWKLFRIGMNADYFDNPTTMKMATAIVNPGDVVFAVSHSGSTTVIINSLSNARSRGAKTIGLTNYVSSPMTQHTDVLLLTASRETGVREEEMTARIAQLAIIDALFVTIANRSYENSSALLKKTRVAASDDKV
jgi:DNA-binding MurR/RpiR family transcriptional regulator